MDLLNRILTHILGNKYYANIINTRISTTASFLYIETVSFRSRKKY